MPPKLMLVRSKLLNRHVLSLIRRRARALAREDMEIREAIMFWQLAIEVQSGRVPIDEIQPWLPADQRGAQVQTSAGQD